MITNRKNYKLTKQVDKDSHRIKKAEQDRHSILAYTSFLGVLGVVFVLPLVGGAYIGRWLDGFTDDYSVRWTISLTFLGLVLGAINVYLLVRRRI